MFPDTHQASKKTMRVEENGGGQPSNQFSSLIFSLFLDFLGCSRGQPTVFGAIVRTIKQLRTSQANVGEAQEPGDEKGFISQIRAKANPIANSGRQTKEEEMRMRLFLLMSFLFVIFCSTPVTAQNTPPVANAGPNQAVAVGATVQLNGSGSSDVDGNPLTYSWSITLAPPGSSASLSNPNTVNPTFVADRPGTYVIQLIVNDGFVNSAPSTVTVSTPGSTSSSISVPTLGEWGMLLLTLILALLSVYYLKKAPMAR